MPALAKAMLPSCTSPPKIAPNFRSVPSLVDPVSLKVLDIRENLGSPFFAWCTTCTPI